MTLDADIDALDALERDNPVSTFIAEDSVPGVGMWAAAPWQREVFKDPNPLISIRGANGTGKSTELALIAWSFLLDLHPTWRRPRDRDAVIVYLGSDLDKAYANDIARSLHDFHTPAIVKDGCEYTDESGYRYAGSRMLATKHGRIVFYSGHQDPGALRGVWGDLVLVNELPTSRHWGELMRSSAKSNVVAPIVVGFTAVPPEQVRGGDDMAWYWKEIDDPEKGWKEYVVPLRPDTTPHRSQESRDAQTRRTRPWERAQRIDAARHGPAPDRRLGNYDDARCTFSTRDMSALPGLRPDEDVRLWLGFDHGELTGREAVPFGAYVDRDGDPRVWVLDCYVSEGRTTVKQDAAHVASMLGRWGHDLRAIGHAVGDVNSSGKSSQFTRLNGEFASAFADLCGTRSPPFAIQTAVKGPGSVDLGFRILDESFGREDDDGHPSLMVHEDCGPVLDFCRRWDNTRKTKHLGHVGDGLRYPVIPLLSRAWSWSQGPKVIPITAPLPTVAWASPSRVGMSRGGGLTWDGSS